MILLHKILSPYIILASSDTGKRELYMKISTYNLLIREVLKCIKKVLFTHFCPMASQLHNWLL